MNAQSWAGALGSTTSAVACRSVSGGIVQTADVRVNGDDFRWVRNITSNCGHSMHLDSTMTHEVGHIYGLADTYVDPNKPLTMYGRYVRCSMYKFTLARGDWRGLDALY